MPAFIPKGRIGRHFRAISRNGLILLMSSLGTGSFESLPAELRLSTWHQRIFKESAPEPYGVLMILRPLAAVRPSLDSRQYCSMALGASADADAELVLDPGGNKFLSILRREPVSARGLAVGM